MTYEFESLFAVKDCAFVPVMIGGTLCGRENLATVRKRVAEG
jgi:hypothetical protein